MEGEHAVDAFANNRGRGAPGYGAALVQVAPCLPFMGLSLYLASTFLLSNTPIWLAASNNGAVPLNVVFSLSGTAFGVALLACALGRKWVERVAESALLSTILGGCLCSVGSAMVISASSAFLDASFLGAAVGAGAGMGAAGSTPLAVLQVGAVLTGASSAFILLRCAVLFACLSPRYILLYGALSRIVLAGIYYAAQAVPKTPEVGGVSLLGAVVVVLLPVVGCALTGLPYQGGRSSPDRDTIAYADLDAGHRRSVRCTFAKMCAVLFLFAIVEASARSEGPFPVGFGFRQDSDLVILLLLLFGVALALMIADARVMARIGLGRFYLLLVILTVFTVALVPVVGGQGVGWGSVITFMARSLALMVWCLLCIVVHQRSWSPVLVMGLGHGAFRIGESVGMALNDNLLSVHLSGDGMVFLFVGMAFAVLLANFLLFSENDFARLVYGTGDEARLPERFFCAADHPADVDAHSDGGGRFNAATEALADRFVLTRRELDVFRYLAMGYTKDAMAEKMCVSSNTIRTHSRNVYAKLGVHSRQELIDLVDGIVEKGSRPS